MSGCTGAVGSGLRLLTPCAGQRAVFANRARKAPLVRCRHVTVRHEVVGSVAAIVGGSWASPLCQDSCRITGGVK